MSYKYPLDLRQIIFWTYYHHNEGIKYAVNYGHGGNGPPWPSACVWIVPTT